MTPSSEIPVLLFSVAVAEGPTVCARWVSSSIVRQVTIKRFWDFPWIHSSYWLDLSASILRWRIKHFCGFLPSVYRILVTYGLRRKEHFHIHKVEAENWLKRILSRTRSHRRSIFQSFIETDEWLPFRLENYAVIFLFSGISQLNAVTFLAPGGIFLSSYSFGAAVFFFFRFTVFWARWFVMSAPYCLNTGYYVFVYGYSWTCTVRFGHRCICLCSCSFMCPQGIRTELSELKLLDVIKKTNHCDDKDVFFDQERRLREWRHWPSSS